MKQRVLTQRVQWHGGSQHSTAAVDAHVVTTATQCAWPALARIAHVRDEIRRWDVTRAGSVHNQVLASGGTVSTVAPRRLDIISEEGSMTAHACCTESVIAD